MKKPLPIKKNHKVSAVKKPAIDTQTQIGKLFKWTGTIIVIAFICFAPALTNELVNWDDYNYIRDNPVIRSLSLGNIAHIFNFNTFIVGNYHPLTILTYAIEYKAAGVKPLLYHLDNIILHLLNIALFAWFVWLLTKKINATVIATALFAFHPMRVESVVWAAERKDVLYMFFFLLALISYVFYSVKPGYQIKYYLPAIAFMLLSLLSKGQAVVLPLTLLLIDYWYRKKFSARQILDKIPFFVLSIIFGIIAIHAQESSLTAQRLISHTPVDRILFAFYNLSAYLYKLVLPYFLSCFYNYPTSGQMGIIYFGAGITIILLGLIFFRYRRNRTVMFGTLFYLFTIIIVIQLLPVGDAIIADRYTYIPYIGFFFIIGILLDKLISEKSKWQKPVTWLVIIQVFVFAGASLSQSMVWKNNETLWKHVLRLNPREGRAYNNLAVSYMEKKDYDTAIGLLKKGSRCKENYPAIYHTYTNLGICSSNKGDNLKAIQYYDTAISIESRFPDPIFNRGLIHMEQGKSDEAIADFSCLIDRIVPKKAEWYYSRGNVYKKKNQFDNAIADYNQAIQLKPDYDGAYTNLGNIYFVIGDLDKTISYYDLALKYAADKDKGITYLNRSIAYFRKQDYRQALLDAETALSLNEKVAPEYIRDIKARLSTTLK
ncbi:MAG: tetratricopeptide repeat protein [Bacteroidetes bacterium]|nr:tetratricopeptide repeat protein [Bacteroidota bacterium]